MPSCWNRQTALCAVPQAAAWRPCCTEGSCSCGWGHKTACVHGSFSNASVKGPDVWNPDVECPSCHALMWRQEFTDFLHGRPTFGLSCMHGQAELAPLQHSPQSLQRWPYEDDPDCREFKRKMRMYNAALCHSSTLSQCGAMQTSTECWQPQREANSFKVSGTVYHRLGPLQPTKRAAPGFAQLYCYDPIHEIYYCMRGAAPVVDQAVMQDLQAMLHQNKRCVRQFQQAAQFARIDQSAMGIDGVSATEDNVYVVLYIPKVLLVWARTSSTMITCSEIN